jgi:predicted short-subunit dehydrogenase-like oxidoreductase (DUF2520 family)
MGMKSVSIIGPGRVGGALALSLPREKYKVDFLIGRPNSSLERLESYGLPPVTEIADLREINSDIVFITTGDGAIKQVAGEIAGKLTRECAVFHTSGALTSSSLAELSAKGAKIGSIHPLVSISRPELGPSHFMGAYFCVEGDPEAVVLAEAIVSDLGGVSFTIATAFKTLYHAAAVMACGHLVALFDSAVEVLSICGLSPESAKKILLPLVVSTVQNLGEQSTSSALTGTFGRADIDTFSRHLTTMNENVSDDLLEIYLLLGERSLELASAEGVSSERIDKLRAKMAVAKSKLKW